MSNPFQNPYGIPQGGGAPPPSNPYGANPYGAPPAPTGAGPYPGTAQPQGGKAYAPPVVYGQGQPYGAPAAPYGGAPPYGAAPAPYGHQQQQQQQQQAGRQQHQGWMPQYPGGNHPPPQHATQYQQAPPQYQHQAAAPHPSAGPGPAGSVHGTKRALIVGVTYPGTQAELKGCINDAQCMHYLLKTKFGFPDTEFLLLRDDNVGRRDPRLMPTRGNIVAGMQWLMNGAKAGDRLFFHFSGHGSQQRDRTGDEDDGMNETILPYDYKSAGQMADDEINQRIVNPLPTGAKLFAVIDACHSGSACDLPYHVNENTGMRWASTYAKGYTRVFKGTAGGRAVQIAACSDHQTAADTNKMSRSVHTGAATYCFIEAVERGGVDQTWFQLLQQMGMAIKKALGGGSSAPQGSSLFELLLGGGSSLGGGHAQTPQLSSNEAFDLNERIMA